MYVDDKAVAFLSKECGVSESVALVALSHARGSISQAKMLLESEEAHRAIMREVREYGLET